MVQQGDQRGDRRLAARRKSAARVLDTTRFHRAPAALGETRWQRISTDLSVFPYITAVERNAALTATALRGSASRYYKGATLASRNGLNAVRKLPRGSHFGTNEQASTSPPSSDTRLYFCSRDPPTPTARHELQRQQSGSPTARRAIHHDRERRVLPRTGRQDAQLEAKSGARVSADQAAKEGLLTGPLAGGI